MCEYCGGQALRAVESLTDEHDAALDDIRAAGRAAGAGDRRSAVGGRGRSAAAGPARPHTAVEEQALFPAMARVHPGHVAALEAEHAAVHAALADAALGGPHGAGWREPPGGAAGPARAHPQGQDGLFPAALISLSADDWDAAAVRARVGSALRPGSAAL